MRLPKIQVHPVKALGDIPATSLQSCFDITHRKQERSHPPKMKPAQSPLRASALRTAEQTLPVPPGLPRHTWAFPGPHQTLLPDAGPEHATRTYVGCPPAPAEHAGKQHGHRETEFPSPALNANILSLEPLGKSPNWPTVRAGKWATTRQSALLGIPTDSRLSRRLVLSRHGPFSPRAPKGTLDRSRARTRLVSSRGAVTCGLPDFMMSFHHRTGPKYGLIQRRYGQIDAMRPVSNSIRCYQTAAGLYDADISRSRLMCHGGVLRVALSLSFSRGFWPIFGSRSQGEHWRRRKWRGQGEFGDFSANYSRFCGV